MRKYLRTKIKVLCEKCGSELLRVPCHVRKAKHILCQSCCIEYNRERMRKWNIKNNKEEWHKRTALKLEKHPNYKGLCRRKDGYVRVACGDNTRKLYHRFLMENQLGRELLPAEIIHHKDKNPSNNRMENIMIVTRITHGKFHKWGRKKKEGNSHSTLLLGK